MELCRLGNHCLTVCPYCDMLFDIPIGDISQADATDSAQLLYENHLLATPDCKAMADDRPSLMESLKTMRPAFEAAEVERQERIDNHPDNGRTGFWIVEGIRHDARTVANSAREAIDKCSEEVQSWESPEARFLGEELPDVF